MICHINTVSCSLSDISLIPFGRKYPLLMYKGHTYKRFGSVAYGRVIWKCSSVHKGCKAKIVTNNENPNEGIESCKGEHNHHPPQYHRTARGTWFKGELIKA